MAILSNPLPELTFPDAVRVNTGAHYLWTGYVLGNLPFGTAGPLVVVRFNAKDRWDICGVLRRDLDYLGTTAGKETIDIRPEDIFVLRAGGSTAPPITPPPVEPEPPPEPPIEPEPEPLPMTEYKIIVKERKPATKGVLPLIVGDWPANGIKGRSVSPTGKVINFTTGDKAGDFGPGGWSGEYCREAGVYHVTIGDVSADIETDGKQFIRLTYEKGQAQDLQVRLVSKPMSRNEAGALLAKIEFAYPGTGQLFEVQ